MQIFSKSFFREVDLKLLSNSKREISAATCTAVRVKTAADTEEKPADPLVYAPGYTQLVDDGCICPASHCVLPWQQQEPQQEK